ncbi:hypothetical protein [Microbulbifer spongiae]|uniref:Uncharacterized protein n=1 Tax=Microbulbifer spongiae TaxID=2944933 RepID=A0ABY9EAJ7_9GAMM|nr:hypothetical protein [Microbulbifer sp. MI-G]WKD48539.1 hypothetical protein M8T91_11455 [Microbulbifer sp. MI-G]
MIRIFLDLPASSFDEVDGDDAAPLNATYHLDNDPGSLNWAPGSTTPVPKTSGQPVSGRNKLLIV